MLAVILAGGLGSRISEETVLKPKPMVEIEGKPILWHIMKYLSCYNIKKFIICCGYKQEIIKQYFLNFRQLSGDFTINLKSNEIIFQNPHYEDWTVTLVDTGLNTMTGSRLKKIEKFIQEDNFLFTYGDGLSNVNIKNLIQFHLNHKKIATITAVKPPGRYGSIIFNDKKNKDLVSNFEEKPKGDVGWINGGFFILNKRCFDYIDKNNDQIFWEESPLANLVKDNELVAYKHDDFWHAMDTVRDKNFLESLVKNKKAPWKIWD